ncbi:MAG: OmpA family protein [Spirochaetes bacterium]|nr:OmpA family protein [Spirochaetota bacterium]
MYIESDINYKLFLNGKYLNKFSSKEISRHQIISINKNKAKIKTELSIINDSDDLRIYKKSKTSKFSFYKTDKGKTSGLNTVKGMHDFPVFPEKDINIGDAWIMPAYYVMPLFSSLSGIKLELQVQYRMLGYEKNNNDDIVIISANAVFAKDRIADLLAINKIFTLSGYCNFLIKFNITKGIVQSIEEIFNYYYVLYDCSVIEIAGISNSLFIMPEKTIEKKDIIDQSDDINIVFEKDNFVIITLLNVQFLSDSKILLDIEKSRIDKVANLLKEKYKNNNIIIIGHAASIGKPKAEMDLSEERAKAVLDYLVKQHKLNTSLLSYEGRGSTEPIADNKTEEGKAMNRRVEIRIFPNL